MTKTRIRCRCGLRVSVCVDSGHRYPHGTAAQLQAQQRVGLKGEQVMSATMVGVCAGASIPGLPL
jgi:hypothetical protein